MPYHRGMILPLALLILGASAPQPYDPVPSAQSAATSGLTTRYSRLYVFGDSYSDIGAGYIDGNGPTAVAYLGWLMGLQVATSKSVDAAGKSLVFAVSGAGTGEGAGRQVKEALLGYGMMNQVRDFAARVKSGAIRFDPETTLFFLAGGLNDGRQETATTLSNLRQQLQVLRELGGRHFTIARLPTKIPQFAAVGVRLNPAYEQFVREEAAGLDLWLNHWGAAFDEVMEHPASYGIVNATGACAGRAIFDQDPTPVGDPATYFFYHEGHPSTAVHRIVAKKLFDEIAARPPEARAPTPNLPMPGRPSDNLAAAKVFDYAALAVTRNANGSERRDIVSSGRLATGEPVHIHASMQPAGAPPGQAHTIEHSEFIVVTEGTLEVTFDGRTERAGPGSVIYIAHGTMHQARNAGPGPARYTVIAIGGNAK
jgi:mannose-6-phosphate isomerase-like protein (cupin superfamily)